MVEDYWQLDAATGWGPENVLAGQGGRDVLVKAYEAAQFLGHQRRGDFVAVSRVPWISYNWGPYAVGANVLLAPGDEDDAWTLTPDAVTACVDEAARHDGRKVAMLVITSPDNPTGRSMAPDRQLELARAAFAAGIPYVLFDWIYHRVTDEAPHDLNAFLLALEPEERDRCIFLDGITKSLGREQHPELPPGGVDRHGQVHAEPRVARGDSVLPQPGGGHRRLPDGFRPGRGDHRRTHQREPQGDGGVCRGAPESAPFSARATTPFSTWVRGSIAPGSPTAPSSGPSSPRRFGLAVVPGSYFSEYGARWIRFSYALPPEVTRAATGRLWEGLSSL